MQVQVITAEVFEQRQESYKSANFLQTKQMAEVHRQRSVYEEVFFYFLDGRRRNGLLKV